MAATEGAPTPDFTDFDAFFAEKYGAPIVLRAFGRDWECPRTVPAATLLRLDRLMIEVQQMALTGDVPDDYEVSDDLSLESIARTLAGDENVDGWLQAGATWEQVSALAAVLQQVHRGKTVDDAMREVLSPGEAPAPNRAAKRAASRQKRSSAGGARSKRTGSGSTAKT